MVTVTHGHFHYRDVSGYETPFIIKLYKDICVLGNVVCQDHISAALALLVHSREIQSEDLKGISGNTSHHWREGMPHPKVDMILMRFATNGDKKVGKKRNQFNTMDPAEKRKNEESETKNPWGDLCKSWGVYDHQEIFQRKLLKNDYEEESEEISDVAVKVKNKKLAMRLGKRSQNTEDYDESDSDSEWKKKSKTPRMRMHADDEESRTQKNTASEPPEEVASEGEQYAPLSIEVVNTKISYTPRNAPKLSDKFKTHSKPIVNSRNYGIKSRLGLKIRQTVEECPSTDDSMSEHSDYNNEQTMSRVQKVANNLPKSSVWSRLEEKQSSHSEQRDLRHVLKSKKQRNKSDDLRERLGRVYKSNLRIEIDNDVHK